MADESVADLRRLRGGIPPAATLLRWWLVGTSVLLAFVAAQAWLWWPDPARAQVLVGRLEMGVDGTGDARHDMFQIVGDHRSVRFDCPARAHRKVSLRLRHQLYPCHDTGWLRASQGRQVRARYDVVEGPLGGLPRLLVLERGDEILFAAEQAESRFRDVATHTVAMTLLGTTGLLLAALALGAAEERHRRRRLARAKGLAARVADQD